MNLGKFIQTLTICATFVSPVANTWAFVPSDLVSNAHSSTEISLNLPTSSGGGSSNGSGTVGGGRRSPGSLCTDNNQPPLTVFMSQGVNSVESANFNQRNSHISLYWYLPETKAKQAEFLILGKNGHYVHFQKFNIPQDQKGLVRIDLPNNMELDPNLVYKWELALVCQEFDRSSDEYVYGAIQVLDNNRQRELTNELELARLNPSQEEATSVEEAQANVYIRYNLWHKAFEVLSRSTAEDNTLFSNNNSNGPCSPQEPFCEFLNYFKIDPQTNFIGIVNRNGFIPVNSY
jgi:hypothetical protein